MAKYYRKPAVVDVLYIDVVGVSAKTLMDFTQANRITWSGIGGYDSVISITSHDDDFDICIGEYLVKDENGKLFVYSPEDFSKIFEEVKADG